MDKGQRGKDLPARVQLARFMIGRNELGLEEMYEFLRLLTAVLANEKRRLETMLERFADVELHLAEIKKLMEEHPRWSEK